VGVIDVRREVIDGPAEGGRDLVLMVVVYQEHFVHAVCFGVLEEAVLEVLVWGG
jgi:hypothetical protein